MVDFVSPHTTYEQLFEFANEQIRSLGYENLDCHGNLGHSIESHLSTRLYIEAGNRKHLGDSPLFTFEPHIRIPGGEWGFKHENIYYWGSDERVQEL